MNYQVVSHDFTNTGGGCMVSTFQVWLADENKTVFLHLNEDGCSLATCDYITREIEYESSMSIYDVSDWNELEEDNKYLELFSYCLMEFASKQHTAYQIITFVPFQLLPKEVLSTVTPDYISWHLENVSGRFETNGSKIYPDEEYPKDAHKVTLPQAAYKATIDLKLAFIEMDYQFDNRLMTYLSDKYPFSYNFNELTAYVTEWCDDLVRNNIIV